MAMYSAKRAGAGALAFFDSGMTAAAASRFELVKELEQAVVAGQFELRYQPIVVLETEEIAGVEALLRWRHPRHGLMSPIEFIPTAERSGVIVPIGRWMLREACRQVGVWQRERPDKPLDVCVNVTTRQLQDRRLISDVQTALDAAGLSPEQLVLEITESLVLDSIDEIRGRLDELKALGVRLAVDDFGTGSSALGYLRSFPLDILKIDKSFIDGLGTGSQAISVVRAIVELGRGLGLEIVAEGIEREDQAAELRGMRSRFGQGYYFARPLMADALSPRLAAGAPEDRTPVAGVLVE